MKFEPLPRRPFVDFIVFQSRAPKPPSLLLVASYANAIAEGATRFFNQLPCGIFSSLSGLTILAILELSHPYQGAVVISDAPFRFAITRMDEMDKMALSGGTDQSQFALSATPSGSP